MYSCIGHPATYCYSAARSTPNVVTGKISITHVNLFEDHYGGQHIVGEVHNDSSTPLQSIYIKIQVFDARGNSILKNANGKILWDDVFQPFLKILFPGDSSGFDYFVPALNGTVSNYEVSFSSAKSIDSRMANVQVEHAAIRKCFSPRNKAEWWLQLKEIHLEAAK